MARLKSVGREALVVRRVRRGRGHAFLDADGAPWPMGELRERAMHLGIPPAWTEVRIAPLPNMHIQACGVDAAGRVQYIYHVDWEARRTRKKQKQLALLTEALVEAPAISAAAEIVPFEEIGWCNPWLDIAAARHEGADSRMFIS